MNQSDLRKWHRSIGIIIALFILFQAGSGLLLTITEFGDTPAYSSEGHGQDEQGEGISAWHAVLGWIHHSSNDLMGIYRVLLGIGLLAQTIIGGVIFLGIRRQAKSKHP